MFGNVDVGAKRDVMGAVTFYVTQLIVLAGISTVLVHFLGMAGVVENAGGFFEGGETYTLIGTMFTLWLGGSILSKRGATNDLTSFVIVAAGVYLAWTSGIMMGMIPIALLTTLGK